MAWRSNGLSSFDSYRRLRYRSWIDKDYAIKYIIRVWCRLQKWDHVGGSVCGLIDCLPDRVNDLVRGNAVKSISHPWIEGWLASHLKKEKVVSPYHMLVFEIQCYALFFAYTCYAPLVQWQHYPGVSLSCLGLTLLSTTGTSLLANTLVMILDNKEGWLVYTLILLMEYCRRVLPTQVSSVSVLSLFLTCYSAVVLALQGSFSSGKGCWISELSK